jgi:excinuclease UvrABC ATPase subunit
MQFLSDVYTSCPECHGSRYREEVLEVSYRGRNIRQVLDLTITEALEFFKDTAEIKDGLEPLRSVGLEYVRLGQPLTTLSGGESQRLKLAAHMARAKKAGTLFIFDEPSVHCMWMKNTLIPLSVAFLDDAGTVINIADMDPHSEQSHCAARQARYALEMNRGWFAARGIKPGIRLGGIPGKPGGKTP